MGHLLQEGGWGGVHSADLGVVPFQHLVTDHTLSLLLLHPCSTPSCHKKNPGKKPSKFRRSTTLLRHTVWNLKSSRTSGRRVRPTRRPPIVLRKSSCFQSLFFPLISRIILVTFKKTECIGGSRAVGRQHCNLVWIIKSGFFLQLV